MTTLFFLVFISWQSDAQSCPANQYWVNGHARAAYTKADGTRYSATEVTGHCRSKSETYNSWASRFMNGSVEGWPHRSEKFKRWSGKEIEKVLDSLDTVPRFLWAKVDLFRARKSETAGNPSTSAKNVIVLYDSAFGHSRGLSRILTHELAHQRYRDLTTMQRTEYHQIAGWRDHQNEFKSSGRRFVAHDGATGPDEDFANNLEYFLVEPVRLKLMNPTLYDWFMIEYGDKIKKPVGK